MLISKFDLYKPEWLKLVFADRNKAYGAYELRQHYAGTMTRAMGITFVSVFLLFGGYFLLHSNPKMIRVIIVDNNPNLHVVLPPAPPKAIKPPAPIKPLKAETPVPQTPTKQFIEMKVIDDQHAVNPPTKTELDGSNIGPETIKGTGAGVSTIPVDDGGQGTVPKEDITIHLFVDVMPEPIGGLNAWSKFLNKNLRFPPAAQEEGLSGRVFVSFVIEKDGSLSNIVVEKGAGHGFDEEALRVLKMAKAWKPGMQNGQPVRVKYQIPINFQLSE